MTSRATAGVLWFASTIALAIDGRPGETFVHPLSFKLGSSSLDEVRERLGPAKLMTTGQPESDGGMPTYGLCYVAPAGRVRFGFKASGPRRSELESSDFWMAFNDKVLGSCLAVSEDVETSLVFTVGGIRLGTTPSEFKAVVGRTTTDSQGRLIAQFPYQDPTPPGGKDRAPQLGRRKVLIRVQGTFDSRGLSFFGVWRLETQSTGGPTKE